MKNILPALSLLICSVVSGQSHTKRVLFLGNSYTYVNNLPQMIADLANSTGDTLLFDSNTPGGCTFQVHSTDATSLSKINTGNWNDVVLQEQSLIPSYSNPVVNQYFFPFAHSLDSMIHAANSCCETIFYMTWGRKNTNPYCDWPLSCTYSGMDSLTNLRYRMAADSNHAVVSPVGAVWHYIRDYFPSIELYQADESHPSVAGTYAAACCFYATLFKKNPALVPFNSTLPVGDAVNIKNAAKLIVYDSLMNWHIGEHDSLLNICIASGLQEENQNFSWTIFPDPANEILTINFTGKHSKESIQIYNAIGELLRETEMPSNSQINISNFSNGLYFVRLKNHFLSTKFIKQ